MPRLRSLYWKLRPLPVEHGTTTATTTFPRLMNFGCGYDRREGYLNVDIHPECRPDLLIKRDDYSAIPHNYFNEILAHDVLEHIPRARTLSMLLNWASWLAGGGYFGFKQLR
jgi:hypothetical protein